MSSTNDAFELDLLRHIFTNQAIAGLGDATGLPPSAAAGNLYISLHTANPAGGDQTTNEADYGGYSRVAVVRSAAGWEIDAGTRVATNNNSILFPACTTGSDTITHVGIGTSASGAGKLMFHSPLNAPASLEVTVGIAPKFDPDGLEISVQ